MLLGEAFQAFVRRSPVAVMVHGILERVFDDDKLEELFQKHAVLQYTKALTFAQCLHVMSDVVFQRSSSVGAWYKTHQDEVPVTRQALYDKLKHTDLPVPVALVQYAGREFLACFKAMKVRPRGLLAGYRVRILDGNHLAGTEHRILELRPHRAAAWGHSFVQEELSMYYLTLEVERVTAGMQIAVGPEDWQVFRAMTTEQFAETLRTVATHMDLRKYTKSKRGPKKKPPPKISGKRNHHVSTARILAMRRRK